jgi:CubicO group peptidase (beta-lactamase class C family)
MIIRMALAVFRGVFVALALTFATLLMVSPAYARVDPLTAAINDYARKKSFSGNVLVQQNGRIVYRRSFGLAERSFGIPVNASMKFPIASITKAFTSVLVLKLVEDGKLDLDAPVSRYLPGYRGAGASKVHLRHLLNHTSGLANMDTISSFDEALQKGMPAYQLPHSLEQLVGAYASGNLLRDPGSKFDYNNADYLLLASIIEKVTGAEFERVLTQRILNPLEMKNTGMLSQSKVLPLLARTYFKKDESSPLRPDLPVFWENWSAAGGMYSTTDDLSIFAAALYGGRLLQQSSLRAMLTPGLGDYGLGLWVFQKDLGGKAYRMAQRPGSIMGANAVMLQVVDVDLTILILSNTNETSIDAFSFFIAENVLSPK